MRIKLYQIAGTRSGDKGKHSNVGIYFFEEAVYKWAKKSISEKLIKSLFDAFPIPYMCSQPFPS